MQPLSSEPGAADTAATPGLELLAAASLLLSSCAHPLRPLSLLSRDRDVEGEGRLTVCAPLLSKYELQPADRLIHHRSGVRGRGWGVAREGGRGIERGTERKCPKRRREAGGGKRRGGRNRKPHGKKMKERKVLWVKRVGEER